MTVNPTLTTHQFTLVSVNNSDENSAHLIEMMQSEEVMRYITGHALSEEEVAEKLKLINLNNNASGLGFWLIRDSTDNCAGMALLKKLPTIKDSGLIEIGYWIKPAYWGQGIAAEVAKRLVKYGFEELGLPKITAVADKDNIASIKSLEKAGLVRQGTIIAYDIELPFFLIKKPIFTKN